MRNQDIQHDWVIRPGVAPEPGRTWGAGVEIHWGADEFGRGESKVAPEGATVVGVVLAVKDRMTAYATHTNDPRHQAAVQYLNNALFSLTTSD